MRRTLLLVILLVGTTWSTSARCWEKASEIVHGSARVLEKGETMIGVVSPLSYGVHDRVTVFTHPALHLLLTPNVWLRMALLPSDLGLSLDAGYQQSFLSLQDSSGGGDRYPGFLQLGFTVSHLLRKNIQVNLASGYLLEFYSRDRADSVPGLYWRASVDFLFNSRTLLMVEVRGRVLKDVPDPPPSGSIILAREFGRMRFGFGATVGEVVIATGDMRLDEQSQEWVEETVTLPVYPWLDLWWRF